MSDDQFMKMYQYMQDEFGKVHERLDKTATREGLDRLTNTIDSFVKRLDDQEIEQAARDSQFERLLDWARKVSEKTGVPLENL